MNQARFFPHCSGRYGHTATLVLLSLAVLDAGKPAVTVSTTAFLPRLGLLDQSEATHWRTLFSYRQTLGGRTSLESVFEIGSENTRFGNSFRLHSLRVSYQVGKHRLGLGRLVHWTSLTQALVDGIQMNINTHRLGSLKLLGGFRSVIDFSDTSLVSAAFFREKRYIERTFLLASWVKGSRGKNLTLSAWLDGRGEKLYPYLGVSSHTRWASWRLNASLVWDLDGERTNYARFRLARPFGNHTLHLGFRRKRHSAYQAYPWVDEAISPAPILTAGIRSRLGENITWHNRLAHRWSEEGTSFLTSTMQLKTYQLAVLGGFRGKTRLLGGSLGLTRRSGYPLSYGASLQVNVLQHVDLLDPQPSAGLYGWLSWNPWEGLIIRLFGRFYSNPHFRQDGRVGVSVNVAL